MSKADILLGLQWGDEGKGKVVDVLARDYDYIARFQGGPNAGHTLEVDGIKHVLHTIPSGVFYDNIINVIGNGVVIDPVLFANELNELDALNINYKKNVIISNKAHIILPTHGLIDRATEIAKGKEKIGSTLKGIGPAYMDKTGRNGLRVGDIFASDFTKRYERLVDKHTQILDDFKYAISDYIKLEESFFIACEKIQSMQVEDVDFLINRQINSGRRVLAEGAQGTLLDVDFGTYPYVTSSTTTASGACTGLGIPPNKIGDVYGIFKAYCTRVGKGPFPTELKNKTGERLQELGNEFGATTGRPRRCGWLDLLTLKYAVMINGVTQLIMTKADVLDTFDEIKVCTDYYMNDRYYQTIPFELTSNIQPVYKSFKGWNTSLNNKSFSNLPKQFMEFINFLEEELNVPIVIISTGPNRNEALRI